MRTSRRISGRVATVLLLTAVACRDVESPTAPAEPTLAAATSALSFKQLSAGATHTCGVSNDNRAYCWGFNFDGQLGNGSKTGPQLCSNFACSTRPVAVTGGLHFFQVSAGQIFSCGLTTDSLAYCWGSNQNGQLGDGSTTDHLTPTAVAGGRRFRQLRLGHTHACAIDLTGVAWCWGANFNGELGDGTGSSRLAPVRVSGGLRWRQLSGANSYTCGVTTDNRAYCWGNNGNGQVGDSTKVTTRLQPTAVKTALLFRQIDAGGYHTCAVSTSNLAYCWGYGSFGQVGNGGSSQARIYPAAVGGMRAFDHVSAGGDHSCGVTLSGLVAYCWGRDGDGELGDGTSLTNQPRPVKVLGGLTLAQVSAGWSHTCGRTTGGRIWCWGDNAFGQLGDGTVSDRAAPVQVAGVN
jgi:alpha-tubulin suppressor-like RCC1 family protein